LSKGVSQKNGMMDNNRLKIWVTTIFFSFVLFWLFKIAYDDFRLSQNQRYTIGTTIGWKRTGKGPVIKYKFSVQGQSFESSGSSGSDTIELEGGRYFVRFLPKDPTVSRIILDMPVPPNIVAAPTEGWRDIPK
jgi:hypothetical protein